MKNKIFISALTIIVAISSYAQITEPTEKKASLKFDWAGHFALGKDVKSNIFLTVGGPSIKIGIGKTAVNLGFCPSLKYNYEYDKKTEKTPLSPILGTGAMISYNHFIGGCIFYSVKNIWYATPAIGYKFK